MPYARKEGGCRQPTGQRPVSLRGTIATAMRRAVPPTQRASAHDTSEVTEAEEVVVAGGGRATSEERHAEVVQSRLPLPSPINAQARAARRSVSRFASGVGKNVLAVKCPPCVKMNVAITRVPRKPGVRRQTPKRLPRREVFYVRLWRGGREVNTGSHYTGLDRVR